ncbi:DUF2380 domain-containing protein [Methylobacterium currus]|uniref:DUF2380 domain-containing protein n=1 Tax=Methylobacterium currus TaxID=2051553 RepID=A0A2R4WG24_9HYPH|nr:DUF3280 domain-containing protein [Methylobacterium currus]AWB20483.1 DUF2380 domain-containing protein [Methylobacterium currus]UHC14755.1 DUF3280 domain-containing protein [Methylobacterium currus]
MLSLRALPALAALLAGLPAAAAPSSAEVSSPAAVFGIELAEPGTIGPRPVKPEDARRLGLASDTLRREVAGRGLVPVDLASQAAAIRRDAPFYKCEGCAEKIAQAAGAAYVVYGYVQRSAPQVLNLTITITEAGSGKVLRGGQVVIQGDTDETWLHGVRSLVKNRLFAEPLPNRS